LDQNNPAVSTGVARDQHRIVFGPFTIPWSGEAQGSGFVSYARIPGGARSSDDWELSMTDLTSFAGVDAADRRFVYRTSRVD